VPEGLLAGGGVPPAIPVTVIGGYLGAGKTTLVNHLLRNAGGERIAVMVNDFGDIGIDADLIESREGDLINLAGGCVCCSFGSDLVAALVRLPQRQPPPQRVLIETSGVALPRGVARTVSLARGLTADAVVVLADAETLRERAADRYVGDTVLAQLRDADLLLLNKVDLVDAGHLAGLHDWLREQAPQAAVIDTTRGVVAPELLFGPPSANAPRRVARGLASAASHRAAAAFDSLSWRFDGPIDVDALVRLLVRSELGLARAKGLVVDRSGRGWLVQLAGRRIETLERPPANAGGGALACIGARGPFDAATLAAALRALGAGGPAQSAGPGEAQA